MKFPTGLKYTSKDEWIRVDGNTGVLGITDYAQDQLSDIVFLEILVSPGDVVSKGDVCASVESVKAASDVYFPVSGTVIAINEDLTATPEVINSDPYGEAWMVEVEISEPSDLDELMDAAAYEAYCEERE